MLLVQGRISQKCGFLCAYWLCQVRKVLWHNIQPRAFPYGGLNVFTSQTGNQPPVIFRTEEQEATQQVLLLLLLLLLLL